jgi:ribulose-5-phosphate 4-epimerase/fuculose-1-phosphate aldolase
MALNTYMLRPETGPIARPLLDKHFLRKHGPKAYYGQK